MRVWDTLVLGIAGIAALYWYYKANTGVGWLSLTAAVATAAALAEALRRFHKRPKFVHRRAQETSYKNAIQALRDLSLSPESEAIGTIRAILSKCFTLQEIEPRAGGFLCREEGRLVWVEMVLRHPEAGAVAAADLARAARRQREEGAEACVLCSLCPAGKPPKDEALAAVRVIGASALALLWVESGVPVPKAEERTAPKRVLRRLLAALVSPAPHGERRRCLGSGALLGLGWVVTRSPVLLCCSIVQVFRGLRGLATKKTPVRLCG